ncbi:MAG: GtrA family protein [Bacteroidetes bacterium]|nr:MAG: GtrA family protein [Bacteroidota bacterium]
MFTFLKAQAVSLTASCIDFLATILIVEVLHDWYLWASITGTLLGGLTYFILGRNWVFGGINKKIGPQLARYFVVWIGYLILNAGFVYLITHYLGSNYVVSKVSVSVIMAISYNYLLQKKFVFK